MKVNPCDFCATDEAQRPAMCLANCLLGPLIEIAQRMEGQDDRCTADPIYVVQQRQRIYGIDPSLVDTVALVDGEYNEVTDEEVLKEINEYWEKHGCDPENYTRTGFYDTWEFVQPFFSEKGAEAYKAANRHRMTDPRIYVDSAYRNPEWKAIQEIIVTLGKKKPDQG